MQPAGAHPPRYAQRTGDHIADYDPRWPAMIRDERALITRATGIPASEIEHTGSTSVPGLPAKPILDIMAAVSSPAEAEGHRGALEAIGYEWRGEMGVQGRVFLRKGEPRTHHLHLAERSGEFWERTLLFRDYLRNHIETMREYEALKRGLMERSGGDVAAYGSGKGPFIEAVILKARAERERGSG
ncbi:MAG: GrpB family protein [Chloroflexi bacterium]|nr:GrpB family protein [Chloroflexota bacterium]